MMQMLTGIILGGAAAFMLVLIWSICAVAAEVEDFDNQSL